MLIYFAPGDFSENFSPNIQDQIQSYHWSKGNVQTTIHPFIIYYKNQMGGELQSISSAIVSDRPKHDTIAVHKFRSMIIDELKRRNIPLRHIHYISDGAASQYKGSHKKTVFLRSGWPEGFTPPPPLMVWVLWFFQNKLTYFDLFYHFIMGKIGPKFSHLLTVRAEGADPPPLRSAWP